MMVIDQQVEAREPLRPVVLLADKGSHLVQAIAQPFFVQLVMRVALAVPLWRPGLLPWTLFLRLPATPGTPFSRQLILHPACQPLFFSPSPPSAFRSRLLR